MLGILSEELGAEAVERAEPDPLAGCELGHAAQHFVSGLVGEREGQDLRGGDAAFEQMGDAVGDDAGLAAAGAGEDQEGPVAVEDGLALGFGEGIEEVVQAAIRRLK